MEKIVWLTVRGEQEYAGVERERTELRVPGTLEKADGGFFLRYEERGGDGLVTKTRLAVTPQRAILTRSGGVRTELIFEPGAAHASFYELPYGTLPVEVETRSLRCRLTRYGGVLELRYRIVLGGQEGECRLLLRVRAIEE